MLGGQIPLSNVTVCIAAGFMEPGGASQQLLAIAGNMDIS